MMHLLLNNKRREETFLFPSSPFSSIKTVFGLGFGYIEEKTQMIKKIQCIYKIKNVITNDEYIGSSKNFEKRKDRHIRELESNKHHSNFLQNSWIKYGKDKFTFEILEDVEISENLIKREQYWIDKINPSFNMCKIASSPLGIKRTEETKEKLRLINKGKKWKEESINKRTLKQSADFHYLYKREHDKSTKEKISISVKEYFENEGHPRIGKKHSDKTKKAISEKIIKEIQERGHPLKGTKKSEESKKSISRKLSIPVIQYTKDLIFIKEWDSISIAQNTLKIYHISDCCKNKAITAGGFCWKFKKDIC